MYRKRDGGQVAAAMQLRGMIKQIFDYAIETRLVTINPAAMVATRYIGKARKRARVLTPKEIRLYLRTDLPVKHSAAIQAGACTSSC